MMLVLTDTDELILAEGMLTAVGSSTIFTGECGNKTEQGVSGKD